MAKAPKKKVPSLAAQVEELKLRLADAEQNLQVIRSGEADAIVVQTGDTVKVFTVQGAETAYRIMVENMYEGAMTLDEQGMILYANARLCAMLGAGSQAITGRPVRGFIVEDEQQAFSAFMLACISGESVHRDFCFVRKDHSPLPVYLSSAPVGILNRRDICIIANDLTERKAAEEKMRRLNRSLEQKVARRTRQLEKQKTALEQSQRELRELTHSLEEQVSHRTSQVRQLAKALTLAEQRERQRLSLVLHEDLQQVLFAIKARFDLLQEELQQAMPRAGEDVAQLSRLTAKAIDTSKKIAVELNPPILNREGLDAAVMWLAHDMENRHGLKVQARIAEDFRSIREEERILLIQLIRELLLNVVKHAGTSAAALDIHRKGKALIIAIQDTGRGFSVRQALRLARARGHSGLFSIEERLHLFGGSLSIESAPGEGTLATVTIPYDPRRQHLKID
jgi:PAS domain S-box-containing protein